MKTFFSTLAGMIIILILILLVVGYIFWSRVPDIVANDLSKKLKVHVQIDDIFLGWGKIDIEKVEVGNTPGSILSKAFSCQSINLFAPVSRYLNKHIVIDEIAINDVYLGLEFDTPTSTKGNWTEIMSNASLNKTKNKKKQQPTTNGSLKSVLIHKLVLSNIKVDVLYRKDGGKVKHLPPIDRIELYDISSEGGLPMDQIMNSVLGQMLKSVFEKENLKNMLQELIQQPPKELQKFIEPFKGLLNTEFLEIDLDDVVA